LTPPIDDPAAGAADPPAGGAAGIARGLDRRRFLTAAAAAGAGLAVLPGRAAQTPTGALTPGELAGAERVAGLTFTESEREMVREGVEELRAAYEAIRQVPLPNAVAPAFRFDPRAAGARLPVGRSDVRPDRRPPSERPTTEAELAFSSVAELHGLLREGQVTSVELTGLYLERLKRYDPLLELVITLTEERALEEAERADRELAAGRLRGPLHGIPWGAKDLLSARRYRTTWGARPYEDQVLDEDATAVERLTAAGAVLLTKLSLGALAWGDVWFGGRTRSPWNPEQGSSGSSAGSACAAAAGLAGFTLGSETWGSIVSPSTRCGATGLRPTFGRVSRYGAMALSWTMDKLGPICRTVEDCALVFDALHGPDGRDPTVVDAPFVYRPDLDPRRLRVGFVASLFEEPEEKPEGWDEESFAHDQASLALLRDLGFTLVPVELPALPVTALSFILGAEAAAAFDELTRSNRDDLLVRQVRQAWPNTFRESRLIPAVEYIQANRVRTLLMGEMERVFSAVDVYVVPSFGGENLLLTNLTGHPAVVVPNGFRQDGTPTSITFQGALYEEGKVLEVARAYQSATDFHRRHPDLDAALEKRRGEEGAGGDIAALEAGYRATLARS
jgi:Asp-tRNA(Asn)/Glu-tRNA(Gln) amidotransferase A subunit family amidase